MMTTNEREAMTDALYSIACGDGPTINNELALHALTAVLAVFVAAGAQGKPTSNIDVVAGAIGVTIAAEARRILGISQDETIQ